jgi:hypothetical protein
MTPKLLIIASFFFFGFVAFGHARMIMRSVGSSSSSARRRRQQLEYRDKIINTLTSPVISIWGNDYEVTSFQKVNNTAFCQTLNSTWFSTGSESGKLITATDLQNVADLYLSLVYNPENFPYTWRNPGKWRSSDGKAIYVSPFDEAELRQYYHKRCPRPMNATERFVSGVISFIGIGIISAFVFTITGLQLWDTFWVIWGMILGMSVVRH